MRRVTSHLELRRRPLLPNRRWRGGRSQLRDLASSRIAALVGSRDLTLGTSFLLRQKLNLGLKLFPRRLHDRRLRWPQSGGSRRFCTRRLGGSRRFCTRRLGGLRRFCTRRPSNIQSNKLGILLRTTFNQLLLHLFILGAETGANT